MTWDQVRGNWTEIVGVVKEKWGKLTDDDLLRVAGKRDQLSGIQQQRYGFAKEQAEQEIDHFIRSVNP